MIEIEFEFFILEKVEHSLSSLFDFFWKEERERVLHLDFLQLIENLYSIRFEEIQKKNQVFERVCVRKVVGGRDVEDAERLGV